MKIPNDHQTIMPYLIVDGAEKFVAFLKKVFDARQLLIVPRPEDGSIMHAEYAIGNSTVMLASAGDQYPPSPAGLFIYVEDVDATYQKGLKAGAEGILEPRDQEYGRSGGLKDPFGNTWWVTTPPKN